MEGWRRENSPSSRSIFAAGQSIVGARVYPLAITGQAPDVALPKLAPALRSGCRGPQPLISAPEQYRAVGKRLQGPDLNSLRYRFNRLNQHQVVRQLKRSAYRWGCQYSAVGQSGK